jgi:hypothetical protein
MTNEQNNDTGAHRTNRGKKPPRARGQSTIQFPYMDLETAISVAQAILKGGGVGLTREQLAGVMRQPVSSGSFIQKIATARTFGILNVDAGIYQLTDIGFDILDSDEARQKKARRAAFLTVPLYKKTYEEFKNKQLPPRPYGLEQAFVKFGVIPKQKTNARLAFDKSAQQAGFFVNGTDRLIEPIIGTGTRATSSVDETYLGGEGGLRADAVVQSAAPTVGSTSRHPFIQGLLDTLPEPATNWTVEGRAKWLQAAANIFDLIYQGSGEIDIRARGGDAPSKE